MFLFVFSFIRIYTERHLPGLGAPVPSIKSVQLLPALAAL